MEIKKVWKEILLDNGIKLETEISDKNWDSFLKKGIFRYMDIIKILVAFYDRKNAGSPQNVKPIKNISTENLSEFYAIDLLIRREAFRVLTPIEVNLKSAILIELCDVVDRDPYDALKSVYDVAVKKIDAKYEVKLERLNFGDEFGIAKITEDREREKERFANLKKSLFHKLDNSMKPFDGTNEEKTTTRKLPYRNFADWVDKMEIKPLIELLAIIFKNGNFALDKWLDGRPDSKEIMDHIKKFKDIRNAVSHHNVLFVQKTNFNMQKYELPVKNLLEILNVFFGIENKAAKTFVENLKLSFVRNDISKDSFLMVKDYYGFTEEQVGLIFPD